MLLPLAADDSVRQMRMLFGCNISEQLTSLMQIKHQARWRQGMHMQRNGIVAPLPLFHVPVGRGRMTVNRCENVDGVGLRDEREGAS
jgi:hypothetical protein